MSGKSILSADYKRLAATEGPYPKIHRMVRSSNPRGIGEALNKLPGYERCEALVIRAEDGTGDTVVHAIVNSGRCHVMREALATLSPDEAARVLLATNCIQQDSLSLLAVNYLTAKRIEDAAAEVARLAREAQDKKDPYGSYGLPRMAAHQPRLLNLALIPTAEGYLHMMAAIREKLEGEGSLLENTLEKIRASNSLQFSTITHLIDESRKVTARPIAGARPVLIP